MNRIKNLIAVFAFSLLVLALPTIASAQWRNDRNNGNYGGYGNGGYNSNSGSVIRDLKNRSRSFASQLDRELDRSRYDGGRREDQLDNLAKEFRRATDDLDDDYDNRGGYNDNSGDIRRVLQLGSQMDRALSNTRLSYNVQSQWNQIRQDLQALGNNNGNYNNNRRNNRNDDWNNNNNRNRRNDRDDDWNNNNNRNRRNNRNFPF